MRDGKSWRPARRVGSVLCFIWASGAWAASVGAADEVDEADGEIGGYARCGADYYPIPAAYSPPDMWGDGRRMNVRLILEERYTPSEVATASADDPALEKAAAEQGQFVIDCEDLLGTLSHDDDWEYMEDSFMD